jgi:acyl-CoA synthetase (AMP-forming)/AMP-acid ligase II
MTGVLSLTLLKTRPAKFRRSDNLQTDWKGLLYNSLRGRGKPVFVFESSIISAANIWSGARAWVQNLRQAGMRPGFRLVFALEPSVQYLWILVAALQERWTIIPCAASDETELCELIRRSDAHLAVTSRATASSAPFILSCDSDHLPDFSRVRLRNAALACSPEIRILLSSSGSTGEPKLFATTDAAIRSVIASHHRRVNFSHRTTLSVLPWNFCRRCYAAARWFAIRRAAVIRASLRGSLSLTNLRT